jgi:hypothetical protein
MSRLPSLFLTACVVATPTIAEGELAERPARLPELALGLGDTGYGVSQKEFALTTGKAYRLTITSTGNKPCAWEAPEFSNFIWLRKIEVNRVEIKATHVYEIEMEREGEAEIFFVPIRPGEYTWGCRGLEGRGMAGKFIVK